MITIVDYNIGNIGSIRNMLSKVGAEVQIASSVAEIEQARKIILPGVGRFDAAMKELKGRGLVEVLRKKALQDKVPFLGICLGMQLMGRASEEGDLPGLDLVPAVSKKFKFADPAIKIPHMGWNRLEVKKEGPLLRALPKENRFYFVHSYYVSAEDPEIILAETDYHLKFVSALQYQNIYGAQFHPEKSHKFGMTLMRNFSEVPS